VEAATLEAWNTMQTTLDEMERVMDRVCSGSYTAADLAHLHGVYRSYREANGRLLQAAQHYQRELRLEKKRASKTRKIESIQRWKESHGIPWRPIE